MAKTKILCLQDRAPCILVLTFLPKNLQPLKLCFAFLYKELQITWLVFQAPALASDAGAAPSPYRTCRRSEKVGWLVRKPDLPFTEPAIYNLDFQGALGLSCGFHDPLGILSEPQLSINSTLVLV